MENDIFAEKLNGRRNASVCIGCENLVLIPSAAWSIDHSSFVPICREDLSGRWDMDECVEYDATRHSTRAMEGFESRYVPHRCLMKDSYDSMNRLREL